MRLFKRDEKRPGRPILFAGVAGWVAMGIVCLIWVTINPSSSGAKMAVDTVIGLPLLLFFFIFVFFIPWTYLSGTFYGAASVSILYFLSAMKRNWRGIAGISLIATALIALIIAALAAAGYNVG